MIPLYWIGFVGLIGLIVVTIVLLAKPSLGVSMPSQKMGLQTHFVNEAEVPAQESPLSAGLSARSEVTTQTEVPNLNENASILFNQGSLGSCVANALVSAFDQVDTSPIGSRLFLQQNARSLAGNVRGDTGTTLWAGIQALQRWGLAQESDWPQNISKFRTRPSNALYTQAKTNRVVRAYRVAVNVNAVREWISKGYPVAVGILVYRSFYNAGTTGLVSTPKKNETCLGGHAVLIVGQDDTRRQFKVRNSWGTSWGLAGHFWLPQDYITTRRASDFWVITTTT